MMTELEKFQLINQAESIEELQKSILLVADVEGVIVGRIKGFNAQQQSENAEYVVKN